VCSPVTAGNQTQQRQQQRRSNSKQHTLLVGRPRRFSAPRRLPPARRRCCHHCARYYHSRARVCWGHAWRPILRARVCVVAASPFWGDSPAPAACRLLQPLLSQQPRRRWKRTRHKHTRDCEVVAARRVRCCSVCYIARWRAGGLVSTSCLTVSAGQSIPIICRRCSCRNVNRYCSTTRTAATTITAASVAAAPGLPCCRLRGSASAVVDLHRYALLVLERGACNKCLPPCLIVLPSAAAAGASGTAAVPAGSSSSTSSAVVL